MKIGDIVMVKKGARTDDPKINSGDSGIVRKICNTEYYSRPILVDFGDSLEYFSLQDLELLDQTPDLSNDPEANELIDRLNTPSEAQKPTSNASQQLMDEIISEAEESRFLGYLRDNTTLEKSLENDDVYLVLQIGGQLIGKVKL